MKVKNSENKWRRLDNTAKIFPVIASEDLSNVFRVSVTLKDEIDAEKLQKALEDVIVWFDGFNVRLRRGFFWYYFETNKKKPVVEKENSYPCKYIDPRLNEQFLFRVSYYQKRINLEVFHAITDGMGAVNFLKELTYHYLRLVNGKSIAQKPSIECALDTEDSYLKNYRKIPHKPYASNKSFQLKGELLYLDTISIIHGYVDLDSLKRKCSEYNVSITKYLVTILIWSIYEEYMNRQPQKYPVSINVPINLRSYFNSSTTMNFFAVSAVEFLSKGENHTFEEMLHHVEKQMDSNMEKDRLDRLISYNVSNEKKAVVRFSPLFIKYILMKIIYKKTSKRNTMTLSNLGVIKVLPEYEEYIDNFHFIIGVSEKQKMKCGVCSYGDRMIISFTSVLKNPYLQRAFFRTLSRDGIKVQIESNGVLNEEM